MKSPTPPPLTPASKLPGKILLALGFAIPGLIALAVILCIYDGVLGRRAWRRYVSEATVRGQKLGMANYLPPDVPTEENFAAAPPFSRVFYSAPDHPEWKNPFLVPDYAPRLSNFNGQNPRRTDLGDWKRFCVSKKWLAKDDSEAPPSAVLRALDTHYGKPWTQFREAAARPKCRFPVRWDNGFDYEYPHIDAMREAASIAALRMEAHLALHDPAEAREDFRLGMRLVSALEKEPGLISGLARGAILQTLLRSVWSGLQGHLWDANSCREIQSDLGRLDVPADCRFALDSERAWMNRIYAQALARKRLPLKELFHRNGNDNHVARALAIFPEGFLYANLEQFNRYYDEVNADLNIETPLWHPSIRADSTLWRIPVAHPHEPGAARGLMRLRYILHEFITPKLEPIQGRFLVTYTRLDQARLACALEEFRLANDQYPETLEALVPQFLPALPRDVMNGESFHYRRMGSGGFLLYSVGMNLRDETGGTGPSEDTVRRDDWAWPSLAK